MRLDGWEARLDALIEAARERPFAWGTHDCVTFALDDLATLTAARLWTVDWDSAAAAGRAILRAGGLAAPWTDRLGPPSDNWRTIRRGDVALVEGVSSAAGATALGRETMTVCTGESLCAPGPARLDHLSLDRARLVWRVG